MQIRRARPGDIPDLLPMIAALAAHHGDESHASAADLQRDMFGAHAICTAFIALGPGPLGYAVLVPRLRLQNGERGADMHHLYVVPDGRGRGVGRGLIAVCRAFVADQGGAFLMVGTHPDNHAAQEYYLRAGFARRDTSGPRFVMRVDCGD